MVTKIDTMRCWAAFLLVSLGLGLIGVGVVRLRFTPLTVGLLIFVRSAGQWGLAVYLARVRSRVINRLTDFAFFVAVLAMGLALLLMFLWVLGVLVGGPSRTDFEFAICLVALVVVDRLLRRFKVWPSEH